ncbi:MAG: hypothetical protein K2N51_16925 [Lachnospiraceae bacterium]|nr:hypothetical protein [Lachnospiraceae bacterium]
MADKEKEITIEDLPEPISDQDMLLHNIIDGTPDISDLEPNSRQEVYLKYIALNGSGGGGGGGSSVDVVQTTGQSKEAVMSQKAVTDEIDKLGTAAYCNTGNEEGNVPVINSEGKLDNSVIPSLAITDTFVAEDEEQMLNIQGAEKGDICIRTDQNKTYILDETPKKYSRSKTRTTLSDWVELQTPTDEVQSVNGQKGNVVLSAGDVDAYTKEEVDGKVPTIVQTRGTSETDLMSQKAVSNNMLLGDNVKTTGINNVISIGNNSKCYGNYCVTIGDTATCGDSFSKYAVAIGKNSESYNYSVALGSYSKAEAQSVVSVGDGSSSTYYGKRRIVNVKDPVNAQDAATKNYVDNKVAEAGSGVNVVQETGESEEDVMSQKAVTDSLATKVDAVEGKGLSTEDFTTEEKEKLANIPDEIPEVNIVQARGTSTTDVMSQKAVSDNVCFGYDSSINGDGAVAYGAGANASVSSTAIGNNSKAQGISTTAIGSASNGGTQRGTAIGSGAIVGGSDSVSIGYDAQVTNAYSVSIGSRSQANEPSVVSVGDGSSNANYGTRRIVNVKDPENDQDAATKNYVDNKVAEAGGSDVTIVQERGTSQTSVMSQKAVTNNTCFGNGAQVSSASSVVLGYGATSTAQKTISIGEDSVSNELESTAIGCNSKAQAEYSVALGAGSVANEPMVVSVGSGALLSSNYGARRIVNVADPVNERDAATKNYVDSQIAQSSGGSGVTVVQTTGTSEEDVMSQKAVSENTSFGYNSSIKTNYCSAFGKNAKAAGDYSSAFGNGAQANGDYSSAFGDGAIATSPASVALGFNTKASSNYSVSLGESANVGVNSYYALALGSHSKATKPSVVSVGDGTDNANYGTRRIINVRNPEDEQDAATKNYVDSQIAQAGGGSSVTVVQTTGTSEEDVMSQKAVSNNTCFGDGAVNTTNAVAVGKGSTANTNSSIAIGYNSSAISANEEGGQGSEIAIGRESLSKNGQTIAIGLRSQAISDHSISIGADSKSTDFYGVSLGTLSLCEGESSVALGESSVATEDYVVSVGSGNDNSNMCTRRIVNVKDPTKAQDAATKNYVDSKIVVYTATLTTAGWQTVDTTTELTSGIKYYIQQVNIDGIQESDNPLVDVVLSTAINTFNKELSSFGYISKIATHDGNIWATCLYNKPTVNLNIRLVCFR